MPADLEAQAMLRTEKKVCQMLPKWVGVCPNDVGKPACTPLVMLLSLGNKLIISKYVITKGICNISG